MPTGAWRFFALAGALFALVFVVVDAADFKAFTSAPIATEPADGQSYAHLRVVRVAGTPPDNGNLRRGDIITPLTPITARTHLDAEPAGTTHRWLVRRGPSTFTTTTTVTAPSADDIALAEIFNVVRLAMILVAIVVAVRRPDVPAARALTAFLITMGLTLMPGGAWLPDPALIVWRVLRSPLQIFSLWQAVRFACIFPFASTNGLRAWLRRVTPWYALVESIAVLALGAWIRATDREPNLGALTTLLDWSPLLFFVAIAAAFGVAMLQSTGGDRQRVNWAAGSICFGFSGPIVTTILLIAFGRTETWVGFLPLTLIAIPLGLAYTILRHRTIDIGFVISRALVLTILSFGIVAAFGLLERALGKLFIDASHVTSRSVEIVLALGLGFSLRSLHAQIERIVDRIFFRHRQRALAALRRFADDVYFITDRDIAVERTVAIVQRCTEAPNVAVYLAAGNVFGCAAAVDAGALPAEVGENDPLFVRMRASRQAEPARELSSALAVEIGFPMFVRAMLVGALVLAAKGSGEAYDPEETALLADVTQRVGVAVDALQTVAMRRELEGLVSATGGAARAL